MEREQRTDRELSVQYEADAEDEHGDIGDLLDKLRNDAVILICLFHADTSVIRLCVRAAPPLEKALLRACGLDAFYHVEAGGCEPRQRAHIPLYHAAEIDALIRDDAHGDNIRRHCRKADCRQQDAVAQHHEQIEHEQAYIDCHRRDTPDERKCNTLIALLARGDIARIALCKKADRQAQYMPHERGAGLYGHLPLYPQPIDVLQRGYHKLKNKHAEHDA